MCFRNDSRWPASKIGELLDPRRTPTAKRHTRCAAINASFPGTLSLVRNGPVPRSYEARRCPGDPLKDVAVKTDIQSL
jgi:hypothetical protein